MASTSKSAIPIAAYSDRSLKETYQLLTVQAQAADQSQTSPFNL